LSVNEWPSLLGGLGLARSLYLRSAQQHVRLERQDNAIRLITHDQDRPRDASDPAGPSVALVLSSR
jgi:hypothetical protein